MEEKEKWLLLFTQKFREILDTKQYREYREFFPAFCKDLYPYLKIELRELFDKKGNHTRTVLSLFSSKYGDQINIIQQKNSFWLELLSALSYSLGNFTDLIEKTKDINMKNILALQKYYNENQDLLPNFSLNNYRNTINLPLDFLESDFSIFVKKLIEKEILLKLKILTHNHLYQKAINRISLLKIDEIDEIIEFLDSDWRKIKDSSKCEKFARIFYILGFEVIPMENLLDHRNFTDLNRISHPELIAYDPNSNYILLFEELAKFDKKYLYKKDAVQNIIARFKNYFYVENRKIDYLIIAGEEISINLDHYSYPYRVMQKETFIEMLKKVFNRELNQIDFLEDLQFRIKIREFIKSFKNLNLFDKKNKTS